LQGVTAPEKASLDLTSAKIKTLRNERASWQGPKNLALDGFIFDEFVSNKDLLSSETQINWIQLERSDFFISQPYEQLASVFPNMGLQDDAVKVMIAKNEAHGRNPSDFKEKIWYNFFGPFIGFAYPAMECVIRQSVHDSDGLYPFSRR
jgi:hypothetical protein